MNAKFLPDHDDDEEEIGSPIPDEHGWVHLKKEQEDAGKSGVVRGKQGSARRRKPKRRSTKKRAAKLKADK